MSDAIGQVDDLSQPAGLPTDEQFEDLTILEDEGHPLVPGLSHDYWERQIRVGGEEDLGIAMTDVEAITKAMADENFCTLLEGETGTGKNTLIDFVCQETNRPRVRVNFGIDVTYEELVGHYAPDGDGDFEWQEGTLTWAVKNGAVFIADELNGASGEATMPLHAIAESYDRRELVIRRTGEVLKPFPRDEEWSEEYVGDYIHPEFKFVGTMNPLGYAGTKDLNSAFKDRFFNIPIPYLDPEDEESLLISETDLDGGEAEALVRLSGRLRDKLHGGDIQTPISTRDLMKVSKMRDVASLEEAAHMVLVGMADYNDKQIISGVIDKTSL